MTDGKIKFYKSRELGKKKNENEEAVMKMEREKKQRKHKEPKEQIIVDLGERKNKTAKNDHVYRNKTPSEFSKSKFQSAFNEGEKILTKENTEKLRQNEDIMSDTVQNSENLSKW